MIEKSKLLSRLFAHKDTTPFILITDTLAQPAAALTREFLGVPHTFDPLEESPLVVIPDLAHVDMAVIPRILARGSRVIAVYHTDLEPEASYTPSNLVMAEYMATTILKILPSQELRLELAEDPLLKFKVFNDPKVLVSLTHRRKSGNAVCARYWVDTVAHTAELQVQAAQPEDDPSQLAGLTTFNLDLTAAQREKREKVELPFMAAQELGDGGASGGAIIYQFEKDDDYDEEDPYEDPI